MGRILSPSRVVIAVILVALGLVPFAVSQTDVSMSFNGDYSAVSCIGPDGCVGAGLYGGTINGVNVGPGQAIPGMICDDYADNITNGETWTASAVDVANLNSSNIGSLTLFGNKIGVAGYTEVAFLVNMMFTQNLTPSQQAAISEAIWFITGGTSTLKPGTTLDAAAQAYVNAAMAAYAAGKISLSQFANLYLFTPTPQGPGEAQEMWSLVSVPEGGSAWLYLLFTSLACGAAIVLRSRHVRGEVRLG